jgi:hypothetical protein
MTTNRKGYDKEDYASAAAAGMTMAEAARYLGVSPQNVRRMAENWGIDFKKGTPGRKPMYPDSHILSPNGMRKTVSQSHYRGIRELLSLLPKMVSVESVGMSVVMAGADYNFTANLDRVKWIMFESRTSTVIMQVADDGSIYLLAREA